MHDIQKQDASITQPTSTDTRQRDPLSDTGVMRILGDYPPPADPQTSGDVSKQRICPVCSSEIADASTQCEQCLGYVGPSPDYLKSLQR